MESAAYPFSVTLKEEQDEEEIESRKLEGHPADMQKVRICSEGGWVSVRCGVPIRLSLPLSAPQTNGRPRKPCSMCFQKAWTLWLLHSGVLHPAPWVAGTKLIQADLLLPRGNRFKEGLSHWGFLPRRIHLCNFKCSTWS